VFLRPAFAFNPELFFNRVFDYTSLGVLHTPELRAARRGAGNPMLGKTKSPEFVAMQAGDSKLGGDNPNAVAYNVINVTTGVTTTFPTFKLAAESVGTVPGARKALSNNVLYKGRYRFERLG